MKNIENHLEQLDDPIQKKEKLKELIDYVDAVNEMDLLLIHGWCCFNCSFYPNSDCCGCSGKCELCCCKLEYCFKKGAPKLKCCIDFDIITMCPQCGCYCCNVGLTDVSVCYKQQCHVCCLVDNCSMPPDNEIPFTIGCCFLACYPNFGCCHTLGQISGLEEDIRFLDHGGSGQHMNARTKHKKLATIAPEADEIIRTHKLRRKSQFKKPLSDGDEPYGNKYQHERPSMARKMIQEQRRLAKQ